MGSRHPLLDLDTQVIEFALGLLRLSVEAVGFCLKQNGSASKTMGAITLAGLKSNWEIVGRKKFSFLSMAGCLPKPE